MKELKRHWDLVEVEEYVLSVILQNKEALAIALSQLDSRRDFKDPRNQKAFSLIEARFSAGEEIDRLTILNEWVDLGIYSNTHEARRVATCCNGDYEFDPKVKQLKLAGGMRKAKADIEKLYKETQKDSTPEHIAQTAMSMASSWIVGRSKKYLTAEEVEEKERTSSAGEKLRSGIPLLDDVLYRHAGQNKATIKATIFREKHGKTRHACWEVAQDLRQGYKVLYVTMEGSDIEIKNTIKEVLQDEWDSLKSGIKFKSGTIDADEIKSAIIEAVFVDGIDKVVIDYLQRMMQPHSRKLNENENTNQCCQQLTDLCVKYNLHGHYLAQANQPDKMQRGYSNVPRVHDVYGSNQIIKDASLILVGFRPKWFEELIDRSPLGTRVKAPPEIGMDYTSLHSVFLKPILSRKKLDCIHKWVHFMDTDEGLKIQSQEML